jgi:potassium efflux system protein
LLIWAEILPAFSLLNDITLWSYNGIVAGEQQLIPVTLLDLGLAGLILFVTVAAANYMPSFNTIGVDWSRIQWLVAALGVGIGFGLQEIVANFISGIIILFERPIRVGDVVTIGNNEGTVERIRIRATTIRNWDRKELLVPNKEFITGQLINWTLSETTTRIVIPVGLAYGGDVELALTKMMEAANEQPDVLSNPEPSVVFNEFGDNALSLELRCFVPETAYRIPTITALHKAINRKFNDAGLVIAFPQRDVHLDTNTPLDIRIQREVQ